MKRERRGSEGGAKRERRGNEEKAKRERGGDGREDTRAEDEPPLKAYRSCAVLSLISCIA